MSAANQRGPGSDSDFEWTCRSGEVITVPSTTRLDPDVDSIEAYESDPDKLSTLLRLIRSAVDPEVGKILGLMRASEFRDFATKWGEHSGIRVGESLLS